MRQTKIICILSMHRSGSSLVANIISQNGISLGQSLIGKSGFNEEGHFEDRFIVGTNKKILLHFKTSWCGLRRLPENWLQDRYIHKLRRKAITYAENVVCKNHIFVFKDPRTCLTVPFWESVWGKMIYIIVLRNRQDVVNSVIRRNNIWLSKKYVFWRFLRCFHHLYIYRGAYERITALSEEDALKLWRIYNNKIGEFSKGKEKIVVRFEDIVKNPEKKIIRIMQFINPYIKKCKTDIVKARYDHGNGIICQETDEQYRLLIR